MECFQCPDSKTSLIGAKTADQCFNYFQCPITASIGAVPPNECLPANDCFFRCLQVMYACMYVCKCMYICMYACIPRHEPPNECLPANDCFFKCLQVMYECMYKHPHMRMLLVCIGLYACMYVCHGTYWGCSPQ